MSIEVSIAENTRAQPAQRAVAPWRALAAALALHGVLTLAFVSFASQAEIAEADGVQAIEVDMIAAAPEAEKQDAAVGPASNAAAAAPDSAAKPDDVEKPKMQEARADFENAEQIAAPEPQSERTEKPEEEKRQPAPASVASIAAEAAAPAAIENSAAADVARAQAIGLDEAAAKARLRWQKQLVAHLDRNKRYPASGQSADAEIPVRFTIDRAGHVVSAHLLKSSGSPVFDEAALAMVRRSDPVPAPPASVADAGLVFTVPVVFRTRGR